MLLIDETKVGKREACPGPSMPSTLGNDHRLRVVPYNLSSRSQRRYEEIWGWSECGAVWWNLSYSGHTPHSFSLPPPLFPSWSQVPNPLCLQRASDQWQGRQCKISSLRTAGNQDIAAGVRCCEGCISDTQVALTPDFRTGITEVIRLGWSEQMELTRVGAVELGGHSALYGRQRYAVRHCALLAVTVQRCAQSVRHQWSKQTALRLCLFDFESAYRPSAGAFARHSGRAERMPPRP